MYPQYGYPQQPDYSAQWAAYYQQQAAAQQQQGGWPQQGGWQQPQAQPQPDYSQFSQPTQAPAPQPQMDINAMLQQAGLSQQDMMQPQSAPPQKKKGGFLGTIVKWLTIGFAFFGLYKATLGRGGAEANNEAKEIGTTDEKNEAKRLQVYEIKVEGDPVNIIKKTPADPKAKTTYSIYTGDVIKTEPVGDDDAAPEAEPEATNP